MSLPIAWIDDLFAKLALTYGRDFVGQYEGLDLNMVKANWAHELVGFSAHPQALSFALQNLPAERPPNVLQFRAICRRMPPAAFELLPAPASDPSVRNRALDQCRALLRGLKVGA
jgi:hypothetical protein